MNILIAGFQHETNTFAPTRASYQSFVRGEGFPPLARGAGVLSLRDVNVPIGGFIRAAQASGHALLPVVWAGACPSAHVTSGAFERIGGEIVAAVQAGGFDAIYLDLHGAMVTEQFDDGEGELLARVRRIVGERMPIVVSLDLHANVTARMAAHASALVAYRTYPHVDMAQTGERAARVLERLAAEARPLHCAIRRLPFLIPVNGMCMHAEPASGAYRLLAQLERDGVVSMSFAPGFPAADFPECGPTVWAHAFEADAAQRAADALFAKLVGDEARWSVPLLAPDAAAAEAIRLSRTATRPIVIADTQDNPGAGGDADTMGMVRALLRCGARDAAVGVIWDPDAAAAAHRAGVGARIGLRLGVPLARAGRCAARCRIRSRASVRRPFPVRRPDVQRRARRARAGGLPADRRRADRGEHEQDADVRAQPVPRGGHRARAHEDRREQELGAFSRGLRGDRRCDPRREIAGADGRRSRGSRVGASRSRHPRSAERTDLEVASRNGALVSFRFHSTAHSRRGRCPPAATARF